MEQARLHSRIGIDAERVVGFPGNMQSSGDTHDIGRAIGPALLAGRYLNWVWLDPIMGIVGAIMISSWTYKLLLATGNILLDRSVNPGMEKKIRDAIESDGDTKICDLHLWQVGQENYACVLSVIARNPRDLRDYKNRLRDINELAHVTIEIERCTDSAGGNDAPACARRVDS